MGLKILHSADWHLDSAFVSFSEEQRQSLKAAQRQIPGKIADICRKEGCDLVLLSGDLFDGAATRESIELVQQALKACGVPVLISPGNHDYCGDGSPWLEESWPENVKVFTGALESVVLPELDCRIYGAGYKSMDCPGLLENFHAEGTEKYQIAVLHGDPTVSNSPYCPITAAQVRNSGLDYLALGHIHKAGAFRAGATLCAWPGCPMGRGWDELGEKGCCIVMLEDTAELRPLVMDTLKFFEEELDIGGDAAAALEGLLPAAGSDNFYRISLTGCGEVDLEKLKAGLAQWPNVELRDLTEKPVDIWEDVGSDSLRGVYFQMLQKIAEEDPNAVLAAEISRKLLEGREVRLP